MDEQEAEQLKQTFSAWLLLEPFLAHMRLENCSPATIDEYGKALRLFFLETRNCSLSITRQELEAWVTGLYARGLKPKSISTKMTVVKSFFAYAVEVDAIADNPARHLPKIKLSKRLPKALSKDEVRRFFDAIRANDDERGRRDLVLFTLMYTCGLRVSEVATARIENLDLERRVLQVLGKGDKERQVNLRPEAVELLRPWVGERREGWLFPGQAEGDHISARLIETHTDEYGRLAGITKDIHPHSFRHSCAVHYLTGGAPITYVQQLLGHANLGTTGMYTQLADEERERITREVQLAL